jgi:hypothetical protein
MARRPKWLDRPVPEWMRSPEWKRMMAADAGKGVSPYIIDRAFWLDWVGPVGPWVEALEAIDLDDQQRYEPDGKNRVAVVAENMCSSRRHGETLRRRRC